jgi:WD40 repeat protein
MHENAVLGISVHPRQSQIFATACDSGEISLYDLRLSNTEPIILASTRSSSTSSSSNGSFQTCAFNPAEPNLLAVGHEMNGLSLIDIRTKSAVMKYTVSNEKNEYIDDNDDENVKLKKPSSSDYKQNIMNVCFNRNGDRLAALRFKQRPLVYSTNNESPLYSFDHEDYVNCCTLKSGCFAGAYDQYFVTGNLKNSFYSNDLLNFCRKLIRTFYKLKEDASLSF